MMFKKKSSKAALPTLNSLDDGITDRHVMLRFMVYLGKQIALDSFTFWLETQVYKYIRNQDEMDSMATTIYDRYFGPKGIGINSDDSELKAELAEKIKAPTRTTFMLLQNAIWTLLKLECFPKFKKEPDYQDKLKPKQIRQIQTDYPETFKLLDKFLELNKEHPIQGGFKPNVLPDDFYEEHLHTILPTFAEVWKDIYLFLAFREYLYQQFASENLSFYLDAAAYEKVPDTERAARAKKIFDKFFGPEAAVPINVDANLMTLLNKAMANPTETTFVRIKDKIYKVLENEWFPDFVVSPLYRACNNETITFVKSDGGKKRTDSIVNYESLFGVNTSSKKMSGK